VLQGEVIVFFGPIYTELISVQSNFLATNNHSNFLIFGSESSVGVSTAKMALSLSLKKRTINICWLNVDPKI
jgi:hypothetical protein